MKVSKIVRVTAAIGVVAALSACGGDSSESDSPPSADTASAPTDVVDTPEESTPVESSAPDTPAGVIASDEDCAAILRFFEESDLFLESNSDVQLAQELIDGFVNAMTDDLRADAEFIVAAYQGVLDQTVANGGDHIAAAATRAGLDALNYFNNSGRYDLEGKIFDAYVGACPQWQSE
jgi:hypothetical protein